MKKIRIEIVCCYNCLDFKPIEDYDGYGWCEYHKDIKSHCSSCWKPLKEKVEK